MVSICVSSYFVFDGHETTSLLGKECIIWCVFNSLIREMWYWHFDPIACVHSLTHSFMHSFFFILLIYIHFVFIVCIESLFSLLLFSHQVVSDSLRPYRLQHARPHCPSPSPRVCPSLWPLNL